LINEISEELVIFVKHQFGLKSEVSFWSLNITEILWINEWNNLSINSDKEIFKKFNEFIAS
jgi:hypothetical protein